MKQGSEGHLETQNLADALELNGNYTDLVLFQDQYSKRYYLRRLQEIREQGLFITLQSYACQVFMNFKIVSGPYYEQLFQRLNGRGVTDLDRAMDELIHENLLEPLGQALSLANLHELAGIDSRHADSESKQALIDRNLALLDQADLAARSILGYPLQDRETAHLSWIKQLEILTAFEKYSQKLGLAATKTGSDLSRTLLEGLEKDPRKHLLLLAWNFLGNLASSIEEQNNETINRQIADRRPISELITSKLKEVGYSDYEAYRNSQAVRWMLNHVPVIDEESTTEEFLETLLEDSLVNDYLEINTYNGVRWFNKEKFSDLIWYQRAARFVRLASADLESGEVFEAILSQERLLKELETAVENSGYQLDKLIELLA